MEQTLFLIKGDGVKRRLIGEILRRIENAGLDIREMRLMDVSTELAEETTPSTARSLFSGNWSSLSPGRRSSR